MTNDIEKRITALEDIEAIKKLKALYCKVCDDAINAGDPSKMDELMDRFADDARIDFGTPDQSILHEGIDAITKFYKGDVCGGLSYSGHMVVNPVIEVEGDKAKGSWYVFVPITVSEINAAHWLFGKYEEEYVKIGGVWKWSSMNFRTEFMVPFEGKGWVEVK